MHMQRRVHVLHCLSRAWRLVCLQVIPPQVPSGRLESGGWWPGCSQYLVVGPLSSNDGCRQLQRLEIMHQLHGTELLCLRAAAGGDPDKLLTEWELRWSYGLVTVLACCCGCRYQTGC